MPTLLELSRKDWTRNRITDNNRYTEPLINNGMLDSVNPIPVDKKCRSCKEVKILSEYEFSKKSKDGRKRTCKECKEQKREKICICPCDNCKDEKLLDATYSLMELILARIDEGLVVSDDFRELVMALAGTLSDQEEME
jgi:hypothetical protein